MRRKRRRKRRARNKKSISLSALDCTCTAASVVIQGRDVTGTWHVLVLCLLNALFFL